MVIELIGYLGSALVVLSMLMTSVVKLRVVNTIGSAIFMAYALVIGSYPTALMNFCLIAINFYQLMRVFRTQKKYDLIEADLQESFVSYFLEKNMTDIRTWFPDFTKESLQGAEIVYFACCDNNPASLFIGKQSNNAGEVDILLDYATPVYRDTSTGRFLYAYLKQQGVQTLVFRSNAPKHVDYMSKVGYRKSEGGEYVLNL